MRLPSGRAKFRTGPTYHDGDKVFVEKCGAVDVGEVGIFVVNGDVYMKELGNQCLISHNEKYKPFALVRTTAFIVAVGLLE